MDTPDIKGRVQIFGVHLGKLKLEKAIEHYSGESSAELALGGGRRGFGLSLFFGPACICPLTSLIPTIEKYVPKYSTAQYSTAFDSPPRMALWFGPSLCRLDASGTG